MNRQEVVRGQTFNIESRKPLIYYYSVFRPLPDNISNDLILCWKIRSSLIKVLPQIWFELAGTVAQLEIDGETRYATWNYVLDIFLYILVDLPDITQEEFLIEGQNRFNKFEISQESFLQIVDQFHSYATKIVKEIQIEFCNQEPLQYDHNCVKPLIVYREKTKNDDGQLVRLIDELTLNDIKNNIINSSKITQIQQNNNENDRSRSDIRDITQNLQLERMKKFSKQMAQMASTIFDQLLNIQINDEQRQIAKQFVVIILEMDIQANDYIKQYEKVRFIQPSLSFYQKALQLWMLEMSQATNQIQFSQFLCKAKQLFSKNWDDKMQIPLHTLFQNIQNIYYSLIRDYSDPIQLLNNIVNQLRIQLNQVWEIEIISFAKNLINQ